MGDIDLNGRSLSYRDGFRETIEGMKLALRDFEREYGELTRPKWEAFAYMVEHVLWERFGLNVLEAVESQSYLFFTACRLASNFLHNQGYVDNPNKKEPSKEENMQ